MWLLSGEAKMMSKLKNSGFLTAKRSKQRPARQNKDRAGCMSGFISIFDFRRGPISRRLLSDHRGDMTGETVGRSYVTSETNSLVDPEEMSRDQNEGIRKTSNRSFNSREISIDHQISPQKTSYPDLEDLMNELLLIHRKRNEEQKSKSIERSNSLENERSNTRSDEPATRKHRNFFRRRSKSHECISFDSHVNGVHDERSVSPFSFMEIKKRLKNAIGNDRRDSGCRENPTIDGSFRDHFYTDRFSRISNRINRRYGHGVSRLHESDTKPSENGESGNTSDRISNMYVEAKKHLSEMLGIGDEEDAALMIESLPKTLGKILSFPEYNSPSLEFNSPAGTTPDHGAVAVPPHGTSPVINKSQPFMTDDDHEELEVSDEVHQAEGVVEIVNPPLPEEKSAVDDSVASPSRSLLSINGKNEEIESTADDRTGRPSPVSVLEPLFSDDDISPARTVSRFGKQSAEASIRPLRIEFEGIRVENDESEFEYVEAMLLASGLDLAGFENRWLASVQLLDPSLFDELRLFSCRTSHDQRLLFDATNEILKEIYDRSFGFFPKPTSIKPKAQSVPRGTDLITEVWERLEPWLDGGYPRSLDRLVKNDLEVSRMWMNLCPETWEIVFETEESIFEDMLNDTLLSLIYDE